MEEQEGYFLYKGLKKPLIFKGLKGKYIYQGGGAFAGTLVSAIILSNVLGFALGLLVAVAGGGFLIWNTFRRQKVNGLYNKTKNFDEIHVIRNRTKNRKLYEKPRI